jgi:hypothetical protein
VTDEIWLNVLGLRARVTLDDDDLAAEMRRAWSACLTEPGPPMLEVRGDPSLVEVPSDPSLVEVRGASRASKPPPRNLDPDLERLTQTLTVAAIEALAGRRLMLHACAVADGDRSVIFVGPSGMGKTTIARTLGRRWSYVTDECVAIDTDGLVTPFPKPLSVANDGPVKHQSAPSELGLQPAEIPARPAAIFLLRRDPAAGTPQVEPVSTVRAVALLAEHVSYLPRLESPLTQIADLVHSARGAEVLTYAEAAHLAPLVEARLGGVS